MFTKVPFPQHPHPSKNVTSSDNAAGIPWLKNVLKRLYTAFQQP
ncbi:hypothetical protein DWUX_1839 [Desulfovibrio diazotrophicus]|nr:hypothetical protein DWUX_1839 [Desulfovibrio diazotrophicus]